MARHFTKKLALQATAFVPTSILLDLNKGNTFFAPIYHAIANEPLPHLDEIMPYGSKNTAFFERDLDALLKRFRPLTIEELVALKKKGDPLPEKSFIITFDDGLRHVYEYAAPILERKGVPAIFFLNNAALDNAYLLFRYKTSLLLDAWKRASDAQKKSVRNYLKQQAISGDSDRAAILSVRYARRPILDDLAAILACDFSAFLQTAKPFMTREQVWDLKKRGFGLGGHTLHHPELWLLPEEEAVRECSDSALGIQKEFDMPYSAFAFPFTDVRMGNSFFQRLQQYGMPDLLFGSQKLQHDSIYNMIHRFDGDNNLVAMPNYIQALLLFQYRKSLQGKRVFQRI